MGEGGPSALAEFVGAIAREYERKTGRKVFTESDFYAITTAEEAELFVRKLQLLDQFSDIGRRKAYGVALFVLTIAWLFAVLLTVWASGATLKMPDSWYGWFPYVVEFHLSDGVLMLLIGTSTANVIGLLYVVAWYLFPNKDGNSGRKVGNTGGSSTPA